MAAEDAGLAVALVVECYGVLSYAYSGTKRQVVTRIDVTNTGSVGSAGTLVRPRVRVAAQLAEPLITEWIGAAKALPAVGGPALTWEDALTPMNKPLIAGLTARPPAELVVEVLAGDTVVAVDRRPLTVLQPSQWLHGADYFDALAGFAHVDDKALDALLKSVNALLQARTPRKCTMLKPTLVELRAKLEKHIKNTYLKRIDAPVGVKPALRCWMELNEG